MLSKTLIIAGMHRSGTSLITNWLHRCGLQVGETLVAASASNQEGHFEDTEFLKIHEEILADNGLTITGLVHDRQLNISEYQVEKLKAVLKIKEQRFSQWGWKEPRTCLFLDTYRELLPEAKYLVIVRDYLSVVNSLLKRGWEDRDQNYNKRSFFTRLKWNLFRKNRNRKRFYRDNAEDFLMVWIEYNQHILDALQTLPPEDYLVVNYTMLQGTDRRVFMFLKSSWGFDLYYTPFSKIYKQSLISKQADLSPFIRDESLITRAKEIENDFQKYITIA